MWGRELVFGLLRMNNGRYRERNSYNHSKSHFLIIKSNSHFRDITTHFVSVPNLTVHNPHHIATPMHPYILTGADVFVDDHCIWEWRVDGDKVTMGQEGVYRDQVVQVLGWRWDRKKVHTAKSNLPNLSPIHSKTGWVGISSSPPHWLATLRTGLSDYEHGLCQRWRTSQTTE